MKKRKKIEVDEATKQIKQQNDINYKLLFEAMFKCDLETIEKLIDQKADVNFWNRSGDTPLIILLQKNPVEMQLVEYLLMQEEIDVDSAGDSAKNKTPLMYAASVKPESTAMQLCEMLIQKNCNVALTSNADSEEWTAVDYAKYADNNEVANYLAGHLNEIEIWEK
jgi:ankyrin repeat protein